jgi:hypothetical protein
VRLLVFDGELRGYELAGRKHAERTLPVVTSFSSVYCLSFLIAALSGSMEAEKATLAAVYSCCQCDEHECESDTKCVTPQ